MAQTPGNGYKEQLPRTRATDEGQEGGRGCKARGGVGIKANLWLIASPTPTPSAGSSLGGYIIPEDGLQEDGGLDKALCWGRCDRAAARRPWLGTTDTLRSPRRVNRTSLLRRVSSFLWVWGPIGTPVARGTGAEAGDCRSLDPL